MIKENALKDGSVIVCSTDCKHIFEGDSIESRYVSCERCNEKIDMWNDGTLTIKDGEVIFHSKCGKCYTCNNSLVETYIEYSTMDPNAPNGKKLYMACSPACRPANAV